MSYVVNVGYDREEGRYYVLSSDIDGLHVEASSFEELTEVARELVPELIGKSEAGSSISFRRDCHRDRTRSGIVRLPTRRSRCRETLARVTPPTAS